MAWGFTGEIQCLTTGFSALCALLLLRQIFTPPSDHPNWKRKLQGKYWLYLQGETKECIRTEGLG